MKAGPSILSSLFAWKHWPYYLAFLLLVVLVVVLVLVVRRRRRNAAQAGIEPEPTPQPRLDLVKAWKAFVKGIPREQRKSIALYRPFIVLGAAGSGKSELIDRCLDWQGQAAQFHPSYTDDPLVQIYHGAETVVQELSVVLQGDVSKRARDALLRLWKPLRRGKEPRVVAILDATGLRVDPPDVLVKHAQLIRGKINILSSLFRRPIETEIVLTHMDQFEGYSELSGFLWDSGTGMSVTFKTEEELGTLESCVERFEAHLPLALATRSAGEYLKILSFLRNVPGVLTSLSTFVDALRAADPSTPTPQITGLTLGSNKEVSGSTANPFASAITQKDVARFRPLRRHRVAAAAIAVGGAAYLGGGYLYEASTVAEATRLADELTTATAPIYPGLARRRFFDYLAERKGSFLPLILPSFVAGDSVFFKKKIYARYMGDLRGRVLFPRLKQPADTEEGQKKVLYDLALIYGSESNGLGKLILKDVTRWEETLDLPVDLIRDYLKHAAVPPDFDLPFDVRRFDRSFNLSAGTDYARSDLFFQELSKAPRLPYITREQLQRLQAKAEALLVDIRNLDRNRMLADLLDLLQRDAGLEIGAAWRSRIGQVAPVDPEAMQKLVWILKGSDLAYPDANSIHLGRLMSYVKQTTALKDRFGVDVLLSVPGQEFKFSSGAWHDLMVRSRVTLLLEEFVTTRAAETLAVFFPAGAEYPGLVMRSEGGGDGFFAGNGKVNGFFTKKAFEDQVKPLLVGMPELMKTLQRISVNDEEREGLSNFVVRELEDYAERYVSEYRQYYRAFRYRVPTETALQYVLTQLQLPASPLKKFLSDVERNTRLEIEEGNKYLEPMMEVQNTFAFLQSILAKPKGGPSGFDGYAALLGKMQVALSSGGPAAADEADEASALLAKLSPLGQMALSIFRDAPDSNYRLVETWLTNFSIRSLWQEPFVGPIKEGYRLGLRDANQVIAGIWDKLATDYLVPLRTAFPFDPRSETNAQASQLGEALLPKKGFWLTFQSQIAPVCSKRLDRWTRRVSRFDPVRLPRNMLAQVNALAGLRDVLFDAKGDPRPMILSAQPQLLPAQRFGDVAAVLAFLQIGDSTVYAFNQQPGSQEVPLKWWKAETSVVGAAFAREGQSKKTYRNLTVAESLWSFHRLLLLAAGKPTQKDWTTWNINIPGSKQAAVALAFRIKGGPWQPFQALFDRLTSAGDRDAGP
jgi:hypothetical protein